MKILMVCLGNICRSPIAEGVMRRKIEDAGLPWSVSSAGTNGLHIGEAPHRFSQKICKQYGIDISAQRARQYTQADAERYDLIYAMANDVLVDIRHINMNKSITNHIKMFLSENPETHLSSVPDPWYGGEEGYEPVYHLIHQTCDYIIQKYA